MRLSGFNLYVDDFPAAGSTLIHNTLSGAFTVIDRRASLAASSNRGYEGTPCVPMITSCPPVARFRCRYRVWGGIDQ